MKKGHDVVEALDVGSNEVVYATRRGRVEASRRKLERKGGEVVVIEVVVIEVVGW